MKSASLSALAIAVSSIGFTSCQTAPTMTKESQTATSPQQAFEKLQAGNQRFVSGRALNRNLLKQVKETSKGQYPFATVVSCLDSRTSSELIFDQGMGDVFNARVAGNIVNPDILGSLEFASKVAGSKVVAVIGHTKCGAIKGACDHVELGNLTGLLQKIEPSVTATATSKGEDRSSKNSEFVDRVAVKNVRKTIASIRRNSGILRQMEKEGQIKIVGGMYDIETGKVGFFN
jgi:carbonic anhydrase